MADPGSTGDAAVAEAAALISQRLDERLGETTRAIQDLLAVESPELAGKTTATTATRRMPTSRSNTPAPSSAPTCSPPRI